MKHKINAAVNLFVILALIISFVSCSTDYMPKPRGYFRIDLPGKSYQSFDSTFPYTFDYPSYAKIDVDQQSADQPFWINVDFPQFKGKLHLSYKAVDGNLSSYLEDTHTMAFKHISKATAIENRTIFNQQDSVYGLIFEIMGLSAASPYQFFVTDSSQHFLRGALYFNVSPNNDSLAPVIEFIKKDIEYLITSFKWNSDYLIEQ
jgi:gliding motility-associated lipoprotein GldD